MSSHSTPTSALLHSPLSPQDVWSLDEILKKQPAFHFVGIGGAGMSALALALHHKDFSVSGSDLQRSATTQHLEAAGITLFYGHQATQVPAHAVLVVSTAIDEQNP